MKKVILKKVQKTTLPKFNSSPLKNDGWKTILSCWVLVYFQGLLLINFQGGINNLAILQVTFLRRWSLIQWFLYVSFKGGFPTPPSGRICHAAALRPAIDQVQGVACWGVTNVGLMWRDTYSKALPPKKNGGGGSLWKIFILKIEEQLFKSKKPLILKILVRIPPKIKWRVFAFKYFRIGQNPLEMAWDWDFWRCGKCLEVPQILYGCFRK